MSIGKQDIWEYTEHTHTHTYKYRYRDTNIHRLFWISISKTKKKILREIR